MPLESFPVDIVSGFQQIFQQPKNPKNPGFLCHSYLSFPDSWISSLARGLPLGPHAAIDVEASADSSGQRARSSENESNVAVVAVVAVEVFRDVPCFQATLQSDSCQLSSLRWSYDLHMLHNVTHVTPPHTSYTIDMVGKESADEMSRFIDSLSAAQFISCICRTLNISELGLALGSRLENRSLLPQMATCL